MATTMTTTLYHRDGREYRGPEPIRDEDGKVGFWSTYNCNRCGGAGGADKWKHTGWTCFDCRGSGKGHPKFERLYTAEQLEKLNAAKAKRDAKIAAKRAEEAARHEAEAQARRAEFEATYGDLMKRAEPFMEKDAFIRDVATRARERAVITERQLEALTKAVEREEARKAAHEAAVASSNWVGTIGERIEIPVTVAKLGSYIRPAYRSYNAVETVWVVTMADAQGNQLVSKSPSFRAEVGEQLTIKATVKEHSVYNDIKQTVVQRVAVKG